MKLRLLLMLGITIGKTAIAQTVLTGTLVPNNIPDVVTAPFSGVTTIELLNQRLDGGGKLVLQDATLTVPPGSGEVFWALDELTLQTSTIITNGASLKIICRKLNAIYPGIYSYNPIPTAATSGIHGLDGRNGGNVTVYVINNYQGKMGMGMAAENGGNGVNGTNGKNGGNGHSSRDRYGFCRRCASSGKPGTDGTDGGNGGRGGNGGNMTVYVLKNAAAFPTQNIIFGSHAGAAGVAGVAGIGGRGGKGGNVHGPCRVSCGRPASRARSGSDGKAGVAGVAGTRGKLEVKLFSLNDLLQRQQPAVAAE